MSYLAPPLGICGDCGSNTEIIEREYVSDPGMTYLIHACPKCNYRRAGGVMQSSEKTQEEKK